ncbi:GumC family protein [Azospirillum sp. sgz301742]
MNHIVRAANMLPSQPAQARANLDVNIANMLRTLWRRRFFLVACLVLAVTVTWVVLSRITPVYSASATVAIDTRRSRVIDFKEVLSQMQPHLVTVFTEVEVVRSRVIAQRVADKLDLYNDQEFNPSLRKEDGYSPLASVFALLLEARKLIRDEPAPPPPDPQTQERKMRAGVVDALIGRLSVSPVPQSLVLRLTFNSTDPAKAAQIANAFADAYMTEQLETKFDAVRRASTWLNTRLETLRQNVVASERTVAAYRNSNGLIQNKGQLPSQQKLTELNTQLITAQAKRAEVEARVARVEALVRSGRGGDGADEMLDSPLIQRLREQEAMLSREASELELRYAPRHPQMVKVRAELSDLRGKIAGEMDRAAQALRSELAVLKEREAGTASQVRQLEGSVMEQNKAEVQLHELEREAQANKALYEAFLSRFKETGEQEQIQQADVRIVSYAEAPNSPSYPRSGLLIFGAAILGLCAGMVLVVMLEHLDNTVRSREQSEEMTGVASIGMIPQIRGAGKRVENYLLEHPASAFAEAFRIIWFALKHASPAESPHVIMVTSSVPEEGKSLTALSLARTAANLSMRVVLVDADLRRATQGGLLGIAPERTIVDVLTGQASLDEVIRRDPRTSLDVVLGRPVKTQELDLVASNRLPEMIEALRERYDLVIIDSPPTMPLADAYVLARMAEQTVFCVRWDKTPRNVVAAAVRGLLDAKVNVVGTLLTRVDVRKHARYGYGDIGYYYGRYRNYYAD